MTASRRELLQMLWGLPLAAGCRMQRRAPRLPLAGELVGPSAARGHLLRDFATQPAPAPKRWIDTGVVIVGGGIAGLSAAWRLAERGQRDFVLLELESEVGGTACSSATQVTPFPWGAHYLPSPDRVNVDLLRLLEQVGAVDAYSASGEPIFAEQHLCRDPQERLFYKGRWYEGLYLQAGATAADRQQLDRFQLEIARWAAFRDDRARPAFALPTSRCSDDPALVELDRLSIDDWLDARKFTSSRLRWWVDYACRDDYGLRSADTSAWAGLFYFAARTAADAQATRFLAPGTKGSDSEPPGAPAAAATADDSARPLLTWPEGNGRLVARLRETALTNIVTGALVVDVRSTGDPLAADEAPATAAVLGGSRLAPGASGSGAGPASRTGATLALRPCEVIALDAAGQPVGYRADAVIFAAPQYVARHVVRALRVSRPAYLDAFDYGPWLVANLHLRARPREASFPMAWDNVLYDSLGLGYVVATHQRGPEFGPTVLTYYYPFCERPAHEARELLWQMDWRDCAELCLTDLRIAHPDLDTLVERLDVYRWGHAMIRPRPGFIWGARRAAAQRCGPIHFANTDLSGMALFEEAFDRGIRAADDVLAKID